MTSDASHGSGAWELGDLLRTRLRDVLALVELRAEAALDGTPLTLPLNHLLDAVVAEPGISASEIARRIDKSQQAMSQAADRLVRLGLVERRLGAGRAVGLHPTDAGVSAAREGRSRELAAEARLHDVVGSGRIEELRALLGDIRDALREESERAAG